MEDKEKKAQRIYKVVMLLILSVFITFMVTAVGMYKYIMEDENILRYGREPVIKESNNEKFPFFQKLDEVNDKIEKYYLGEINEKKLEDAAISGYVDALGDKYTKYITKEKMEEYTSDISGKFVGIGIYMSADVAQNKIVVISPIKYSPAEEAGILPGDYITKVDGVEYTADDLTTIASKIKGKENTTVKLEILRNGDMMEFEVTRKLITINPLEYKVLENNTGYIAILSFDEGTASEFETRYKELKDKNVKSLIIDLRNNGGGLVKEALKILNYIVPKDSVILITVNKDNKEEVTKSTQKPIVDIPVVVLVNENTASASEILAGSLKDLGVAKIVGTKTFGKGVIQQVLTLSDGSGLTVTIEEYFTANKNKINGVGIEPDENVELSEEVENSYLVTDKEDVQLNRAIEMLK